MQPSTLRLAVWARDACVADRRGVTRYLGARDALHWLLPRIQERTGHRLDDTYLIYVSALQLGYSPQQSDLEKLHGELVTKFRSHDDAGLCRDVLLELRTRAPELAAIIAPAAPPTSTTSTTAQALPASQQEVKSSEIASRPTDLIGCTKAAFIVRDITKGDCSDDTIRNRTRETPPLLTAYDDNGFIAVSEAEVREKAYRIKKTVGRKRRRPDSRDAK